MGIKFPAIGGASSVSAADGLAIVGFGFDETNLAAGVTAEAMGGIGASDEGWFVPFPFSIVGIGARSNADITQGVVSFEVLLDGVATGFGTALSTSAERENGATQAAGTDSASSGRVGLQFTSSANLLPAGSAEMEVYVYVLVDFSAVV